MAGDNFAGVNAPTTTQSLRVARGCKIEFEKIHKPLRRRQDWISRLDAYLSEVRYKPFELGVFDCIHFVSDCIRVQTDVDPWESLRPLCKYSTPWEYLKCLRQLDCVDIGELCDKTFPSRVPVKKAHRGDVVQVKYANSIPDDEINYHTLGIIGLDGQVWALGTNGLVVLPRDTCLNCWGI